MNNIDNRIALNIIVKNEEKFLRGCLESVKDLVDEIVLADTGSEDKTIEIASEFTDKILYFKWNNDFAEVRNFVMNNTDADWILYLDADERIDSEYHEEIKELVKRTDIDAFQLKIKSFIHNGKDDQVHIVPYPRLFRKLPDIKFEGEIHEQITPSLVKAGAKFELTDIIINHLGYAQDIEIIEAKKKRNLEALIKLVVSDPHNAYLLFQLGQNYITLGNTEAGIKCLVDALKMNSLTPPVKATTLTAIAKYQYDHQNYENAVELCRLSLEIAPAQLFGRLLLSEILFTIKQYEESIQLLKDAYEISIVPENSRKIDVATDISYEPAFIKYLIAIRLQAMGQLENAVKNYSEAIQLNPRFNEAYLELAGLNFYFGKFEVSFQQLKKIDILKLTSISALMNIAGLYEEMKKYIECRAVLKRVIELDDKNAKAYFFIGNCFLYESDFDKAEENFLKSHSLQPEITETILNLAYVSIKKMKFKKALEFYRLLENMNPDDEDIKRKIHALEMKIMHENCV
jgi:tetratricopeptide (TPR) repeat protein